jgi:hypothetical protein
VSFIRIEYDPVNKIFSVSETDLGPYYCDLYAAIKQPYPGQPLSLTGVLFGFRLEQNGEPLVVGRYPSQGVWLVETTEEVLETFRLNYEPETEYQIAYWLVDTTSTLRHGSYSFVSPPAPQPLEEE